MLESRESLRPRDVSQAIFDTEPQIVHFSGHGESAGELLFEDAAGKTQAARPDALANFFKLMTDRISCVVLNACYSETQATPQITAQIVIKTISSNKCSILC